MIELSETICIALITFSSGVVGAISGIIGGIYAARAAAQAQIKQTVVQEQFKTRSIAFAEVFQQHLNLLAAGTVAELNVASQKFCAAVQGACIVAAADTTVYLTEFQNAVLKGASSHWQNNDEILRIKSALIVKMQRDLSNFTEPKMLKNRWKIK